jgi:putative membrane protein
MTQFGSGDRATRRVSFRAACALAITLLGFVAAAHYAPDGAYPWIKALHVIAVISWMAALLYLPRLFVNHASLAVGSPESDLLKGMEWRLLRIIMTPAMILTWIAGLWLAWFGFGFLGGWLHAKIFLVILLTVAHWFFSRAVKAFGRDENRRSARFWRMMNEIPAVLMIAIVVLVIVKPF